MKLLDLYLYTTLSTAIATFIPTKKICRDCKYFIGDKLECSKFGDTNIITGEVSYHFAESVRKDHDKCGENGVFFEKNNFKPITVPYYFLKKHYTTILLFGLLSLYIWIITV